MIHRILFVLAFVPLIAAAATEATPASYRSISGAVAPKISVPTVIDVALPATLEVYDALVLDNAGTAVPRLIKYAGQAPVFHAREGSELPNSAFPADMRSFSFNVNGVSESRSTIIVTSPTTRSVSGFTVFLGENVALPSRVEVHAVGSSDTVVLAPTNMQSQTIKFPTTSAKEWRITFTHIQPLRIAGIRMISPAGNPSYSVRFLAYPGRIYTLYADPDVVKQQTTGESGNLASDKDVVRLKTAFSPNQLFQPADSDADGTPDRSDNCVSLANSDQADTDNNGQGDLCDDWDRDSLISSIDNCPDIPNARQTDTDGDAIGDECDGEESRFTEANKWVPWLAIGFAAFVILALATVLIGRTHPPLPPVA